jgi:FkbM family methyltransferase
MRRGVSTSVVRGLHRVGAWVFDRSGPLAPALAALGEPMHRWLFPKSLLADPRVPIEVDGLRLYHEGRPSYHLQMLAMGMHDRDVAGLLREVVKPRATVVDVGAHLGYFTLLAARLAGVGGAVWAFEPAPSLVPLLRRNVAENPVATEVHVVESAVGDRVGTVRLAAGDDDSMLAHVLPDASGPGWDVACTTLDAWAREHGWPRVDVVKLDVEGSEVSALRGMTELCGRNPHLALIVELNEDTLAAAGESVATFATVLARCGLDAVALPGTPARPVELPQDLDAVRREVRRLGNGRVNLLCSRAT